MTSVHQGETVALTAQFYQYAGGPPDDLQANPTITLTPVAGGSAAVGPTSTGVSHPATGLYGYSWAVPTTLATGDYVAVWSGTDAQSDAVQASEVITVLSALSISYTDLSTLKASLGIADTTRDTLLTGALTAASRQIDRFTGRRFYADTTATARIYNLYSSMRRRLVREIGGELLLTDDIATTTGLVVEVGYGSSFTAVTDYIAEPDNAILDGRPITGLRRDMGYWGFSVRTQVRVTAAWGWPSVPDEVAQACLIQATRLYRRKDSPEGVAGSAEWGVVRMSRVDPDVRELLRPFKLPGIG